MLPRSLLAAAIAVTACVTGCNKPLPAPDPKGDDLVEGAVVAAVTTAETTPGVRIYKVIKVERNPPPFSSVLYLTTYEPKAPSFEEAVRLRSRGNMKTALTNFDIALYQFMKLDHRVIGHEPITDSDRSAPETPEQARIRRQMQPGAQPRP